MTVILHIYNQNRDVIRNIKYIKVYYNLILDCNKINEFYYNIIQIHKNASSCVLAVTILYLKVKNRSF